MSVYFEVVGTGRGIATCPRLSVDKLKSIDKKNYERLSWVSREGEGVGRG